AVVGQRIDPSKDTVKVQGKAVGQKKHNRYVLIYKPVGYISTTADELQRQTVLDLVPEIKERLYPVGRLDKDSEGLMLLTTDGDLTQRLTHPRYQFKKTYRV